MLDQGCFIIRLGQPICWLIRRVDLPDLYLWWIAVFIWCCIRQKMKVSCIDMSRSWSHLWNLGDGNGTRVVLEGLASDLILIGVYIKSFLLHLLEHLHD